MQERDAKLCEMDRITPLPSPRPVAKLLEEESGQPPEVGPQFSRADSDATDQHVTSLPERGEAKPLALEPIYPSEPCS